MIATITAPTVLMPGMTATPTSRGVLVIDLGPEADPIGLTPEILDMEKARLGCRRKPDGSWDLSWKYRKEYLRDFGAQAGQHVFDADWLDRQRPNIDNPLFKMDLQDGELIPNARGRLSVWIRPDFQPREVQRLGDTVKLAFGIGIDVSEGVGNSDSTIEVFRADNREQAAEFKCNHIRPGDLGRMAAAIGRYYNNALICCVRKMHGVTTLRTLLDECHYPYLWADRSHDGVTEKRAEQLGWAQGEASSPALFGRWMDEVQYGRVTLHSMTLLQQHEQYIYDEAGRITHQSLAHLPTEVRNRHGDLVIGSALALRACIDMPRFVKRVPVDTAPFGSINWMREHPDVPRDKDKVRW